MFSPLLKQWVGIQKLQNYFQKFFIHRILNKLIPSIYTSIISISVPIYMGWIKCMHPPSSITHTFNPNSLNVKGITAEFTKNYANYRIHDDGCLNFHTLFSAKVFISTYKWLQLLKINYENESALNIVLAFYNLRQDLGKKCYTIILTLKLISIMTQIYVYNKYLLLLVEHPKIKTLDMLNLLKDTFTYWGLGLLLQKTTFLSPLRCNFLQFVRHESLLS